MSHLVLPDAIREVCRDLLRRVLGSRAEMTAVSILNHHPDYWVLRAHVSQPEVNVVLKLAGPQAPLASDFERTAMLHRLIAAKTPLKVAEILAADTSCQIYPWRYLMETFVGGQEWRAVRPLLDASQQQLAYRQIGNAIAQIHSVNFPAFGELTNEGIPQGTTDYLPALRERTKRSIKNPRLAELFLKVLEDHADLFVDIQDACLCHEDLNHRNLLFRKDGDKWEFATVLDFDKAWSGHHEIDLARLEFWDDMVGNGFWNVYGAPSRLDPAYELRRPIYQLLWCLEFSVSTPRHLRDTQQLCKQLGLPMIEDFAEQ